MKQINLLVVAALCLFYASAARSQNEDTCGELLVHAPMDVNKDQQNDYLMRRVYEKLCSDESVKDSNTLNIGVSAMIESIPASFNLGSGSATEKAANFCKTYSTSYKQNLNRSSEVSKGAENIVDAWMSCKAFAFQGINFRPKIARTLVVVEVARTNALRASVQGISYDPKLLSCSVPNSKASSKRIVGNEKTVKILSSDYWPVFCKRIPIKQRGQSVYPTADLAIATTRGSFLLPIQSDALPTYKWSSEIQERIDDLEKALDVTRKNLNDRISGIRLVESDQKELPAFSCGGQAVAPASLQVMYGSRDGTSCSIPNINWVKTLSVQIPPK